MNVICNSPCALEVSRLAQSLRRGCNLQAAEWARTWVLVHIPRSPVSLSRLSSEFPRVPRMLEIQARVSRSSFPTTLSPSPPRLVDRLRHPCNHAHIALAPISRILPLQRGAERLSWLKTIPSNVGVHSGRANLLRWNRQRPGVQGTSHRGSFSASPAQQELGNQQILAAFQHASRTWRIHYPCSETSGCAGKSCVKVFVNVRLIVRQGVVDPNK